MSDNDTHGSWFAGVRDYDYAGHWEGPIDPPTETAVARGLFVMFELGRLGVDVESFDYDVIGGIAVCADKGDRSVWVAIRNGGAESHVLSEGGKLVQSRAGKSLEEVVAWLEGGEVPR